MTHRCCSACRVRFAPESGIALDECPRCGGPTEQLPAAEILGFHLVEIADPPRSLPAAIAAAFARSHPGSVRS